MFVGPTMVLVTSSEQDKSTLNRGRTRVPPTREVFVNRDYIGLAFLGLVALLIVVVILELID